MLKRMASVILVTTLLITVNISVKAEELQIYLFDDFEYYTQGSPMGWTAANNGLASAPVFTKSEQGTAVKLTSTQEVFDGNLQKQFNPYISGKVVIEAKVWCPDVLHRRAIFTTKDGGNRENLMVQFGNNGYIMAQPGDTKIMLYQPKRWYHIQAMVDLDEKTYDLYIDGVLKLTAHPFANKDIENIALIRFAQWDRDNSFFYIDDIFFYKSSNLLGKDELKSAFKVSYSDISGHWAENGITYLSDRMILIPSEDGKFHPDDKMSRSEFVRMLYNAFGFPSRQYVNVFMDVTGDMPFADNIQAAVDAGIISGYAGKFEPNANMTAVQCSKLLVEVYKWSHMELPGEGKIDLSTLQKRGDWAINYMGQANQLGLFSNIKGINDKRVNPNEELTKAQVSLVMKNFLSSLATK